MNEFQRARKPEEKAERRAHLLGTARTLLGEGVSLRDLSLNELARRASMTKSNVYRYFETREAVLLALLVEDWTTWFAAFRETAKPPAESGGVPSLVRDLTRSLAAHPTLCLLTSVLPSVLEQNLSDAAVLEFKLLSLSFFSEVGDHLTSRTPALSRVAAARLLNDAVVAVVGLYPLTHPADAVRRVMEHPQLRGHTYDFAAELERFLLALAGEPAGEAPAGA